MADVPVTPARLAAIRTRPGVLARTSPTEDTTAIVGSSDDQ
jgi:hypothetical protein